MEKSLAAQFNHSVELDQASADLFELEIELEIVARVTRAKELFAGRVEFRWELEELDAELAELEQILGGHESWELCARIRDLRCRHLSKLIARQTSRGKTRENRVV